MRLSLTSLGFLVVCAASLYANPIAVDPQRRPATMTAEDVTVTVGTDYSTVFGRYSFQQQPDDMPEEADSHVLIYVPVLLSRRKADRYEERFGTPVVTIKGKRFPAAIRNDLAYEDHPESVPLPKGWFMQVFEARIPLRIVSDSFHIEVSYSQPHFPGSVSGYVPIRPPNDSRKAKIRFTATEGHALRPVGFLSGLAPKRRQMEFTPQHRKLISARLVNK